MGENDSAKVFGFLRSWGTYWCFSMSRIIRFDGIVFRVSASSHQVSWQTYAPLYEEDIDGNSGTPNDPN